MPKTAYMRGAGPGPITPDGCPVDLYAQLRANGEPELIDAAIPAASSILELGAGAGRITHPLVAFGHGVVAVDESPDMLAHIKGARTVCAPIEELSLGRTFDVVVLMSFLVEIPDDRLLRAFLRTCRSHVRDSGQVIIERHAPGWHDTVQTYERLDDAGRTIRMREVQRPAPGLLAATVDYDAGDRSWSHSFLTRQLDDDRLQAELALAGLRLDSFLTPDRRWLRARPDLAAADPA
jgi:SAM-dependent methyltransferase